MARFFARVLVAFDGSEAAQDALALGLRLLELEDGMLVLGCVVEQRGWAVPGRAGASRRAVDAAAEMLAGAQDGIPAGIRVRVRTPLASSAARGLTELAEAERADLIVVGSAHGSATGGRIG